MQANKKRTPQGLHDSKPSQGKSRWLPKFASASQFSHPRCLNSVTVVAFNTKTTTVPHFLQPKCPNAETVVNFDTFSAKSSPRDPKKPSICVIHVHISWF
jgi:hypothetical protein